MDYSLLFSLTLLEVKLLFFAGLLQLVSRIFMQLILYSKPGCHLCEGLQEKLEQVTSISFDLEVRDITTRDDWLQAYQYSVPVLRRQIAGYEETLPRPSPRASVGQLTQLLQQYQS